jgi:hypothetical protein
MKDVNEAYKRWEKEKSEEAKAAWYQAVRRFSEICNYSSAQCERNRRNKTKAQRKLRRDRGELASS